MLRHNDLEVNAQGGSEGRLAAGLADPTVRAVDRAARRGGDRPFATRQTAALLALLAYHLGQSLSRERLIEAVWPDAPLHRGRQRLSTALTSLRKQLEPHGVQRGAVLQATREAVQLRSETVTTDVGTFAELLQQSERVTLSSERRALLSEAIRLHRDELLPGAYEDWIEPERRALREQAARAAAALAELQERDGEVRAALAAARRAAEIDPLREEAQRTAIRLAVALGEQSLAQRQFDAFRRRLRDDLAPSRRRRLARR